MRRRVGALLRPYRKLILLAGLGIVGSTAVTVAAPLLLRYAINDGVLKHDFGPVNRAALAYLGFALVRPLIERLVVLSSARAGERFLGDLRVAAYDHLQRLSMPFFESERAGVLVSRLTADVQSLTTFVRQVLVEIVGNLLTLIVTLSILLYLSPLLTLVVFASTPILIASSASYRKRSRPAVLALRDRVADVLTALQEGLTGMRVIQSFAREREQEASYRVRSWSLVRAWRAASLVNMRFFPAIALAQAVSTSAVLAAGGWMYWHGRVSLGTLAAFVVYLGSLFEPVARLGDWYSELQSGRAALMKIVGLLDTPVTVVPGTRDLPERGELVVESATFSYDGGRPAVDDVSLSVRQGEHLALVGATGAGKSTLAKLLTRQYDPGEGRVTFGGVDLREATAWSLRDRIVFLPQEGHLFAGSIADNVRLARPDAGDADVEEALRRIGALERFARLPGGIHTDVQTRGLRLSSGERQLIALARAALVEPAVVVLDEATSSLDPGTERDVERAIAAVSQGRTVITIAHRLSTAERADRVALLEGARLIELATHDELVAQGARYAALWASWQAGLEVVRPSLSVEPSDDEPEEEPARRAARPQDEPRGERV
ncbi:MAG: ABC transporter ATP-binding protein [Gaiellaceae bacterium]